MLLRRYKALLFDMDGTLIDSMPLWERAYYEVLVEGGFLQEKEFPTFLKLLKRGGDPVIEMFPGISWDERGAIYERARRYVLRHAREVRTLLSEEDLLLLLDGRPAAVVTQTGYDVAQRLLKGAGIFHLFDVLVTSDAVKNVKPHPEPIWRALDEIGEVPAVYVGDSPADEEAAHNAGIDFIHAAVIHRVRRHHL